MNDAHAPPSPSALEIRHLRLIQAVAHEGGVTRAAGRLHLSQSAISHQLVDLERALGTRLFDRVGRRMVITEAGAKLLAGAERVLRDLRSMEQELTAMREDARTALRVTTSCYTSYRWLPAALHHFAKSHAKVDVSIVLEATSRAEEALDKDEVDFAIMTRVPRDPGLASELVVESDLVLVGRPDHPVLQRGGLSRGAVKWTDLRGATLLMHDVSTEHLARIERAVRDGDGDATPSAEGVRVQKIPLTEALLELARAGSGVVLVDRWIVEPHLPGRRKLVALPLTPVYPRRFHAVWRRTNPRGLPLRELSQIIRRESAQPGAARRVRAR